MDHELKMWLICFGISTPLSIAANFVWWWFIDRKRIRRKYNRWSQQRLGCHVVGCNREVTHSHWPHDDCYDLQYFCPQHTGELMDPNRSYTVEPWKTELADKTIKRLVESRLD